MSVGSVPMSLSSSSLVPMSLSSSSSEPISCSSSGSEPISHSSSSSSDYHYPMSLVPVNLDSHHRRSATPRQAVKEHCIRTLSEVGGTPELASFYAEALQCEHDMTYTVYSLQKELRAELAKTSPLPPVILFGIIQSMIKCFHAWKMKIDRLSEQGVMVPPLHITLANLSSFKAVCSFDTNEVHVQQGDDVVITDASQPNWLRVRTSKGEEGYVPAMCCVLPTPDNTALTAVERLQILLLTSWTENCRKLNKLLVATLRDTLQQLTEQWKSWLAIYNNNNNNNNIKNGKSHEIITERFKSILDLSKKNQNGVDFSRLHRRLGQLETELISGQSTKRLSLIVQSIAFIDRAVLCYQTFHNQWRFLRQTLNEASRPIRIVEKLEQLRRASQCKMFKYYEMKMTLEEQDTLEEVSFHLVEASEDLLVNGTRSKRETATSEPLTAILQEERTKFVIKEVVDPRNGEKISFEDAVSQGIINHGLGRYINPDTGQGMPLPIAMQSGVINVAYSFVKCSPPQVRVLCLVTIRRRTANCQYTITGALDATTAERVTLPEAKTRGLIDLSDGQYINRLTGKRLPLDEAIDDGWVLAEFDPSSPPAQFESKTYVVLSVLDQATKKSVPLRQALRSGLIDRKTGNYIDNVTKKKVFVSDAIDRGLINAILVTDIATLASLTAVADQKIQMTN